MSEIKRTFALVVVALQKMGPGEERLEAIHDVQEWAAALTNAKGEDNIDDSAEIAE